MFCIGLRISIQSLSLLVVPATAFVNFHFTPHSFTLVPPVLHPGSNLFFFFDARRRDFAFCAGDGGRVRQDGHPDHREVDDYRRDQP